MPSLKRIIENLLCIFIFLLPFQTRWIWKEGSLSGGFWEYGSSSIYATEILLWVILLLYFLYVARTSHISETKFSLNMRSMTALFLFGLLGYVWLSIFWSGDKQIAYLFAFRLIEAVALGVLIVSFDFHIKKFIWAFVFSGVLQAVFAFTQFFTQRVYASKWLGVAGQNPQNILGESVVEGGFGRILRAYGALPHPNILGGFFVITILFSLYLFSCSRKRSHEFFALLFLLMNILGLFLTFSRAAFFAFIISSLIYFGGEFLSQRSFNKISFLAFIFIIFTSLLVVAHVNFGVTRFQSSSRLEAQSGKVRQKLFQESVTLIQRHLMIGVGAGNFTHSVFYELDSTKKSWEYQPVHNIYLLILSELGIFGLFVFFLFCIFPFLFSWKQKNFLGLSLLCALFTLGIFDHYLWSLYFGTMLFWTVLGFSLTQQKTSLNRSTRCLDIRE